MTADQIPVLTEAEHADMGERLHEAVARFILLRASSFWGVETFRVFDVVGELTTRQAKWLLPYIGVTMRQRLDVDTLNLPIMLPTDLQDSADEIHTLQAAPRTIKLDEASISQHLSADIFAMELTFAKAKRSDRRAA
jgi:hypothetical protein